MGVRAIQAKVLCDDRTTLEHFWRTHCVFNERLPELLAVVLRMRRGESGNDASERKLYQTIAEYMLGRNAKDAPYLLNSVSIPNWKPATAIKQGANWATEAAELSKLGKLLYNKEKMLGDVPDTLRQMLAREVVAIISGHDELVRIWQQEREDWQNRKAKWEAEHPDYMKLRPRFEEGERERAGITGKSHRFSKRAERDQAYLDWLERNADLAAWRGKATAIVPLDDASKARIARVKPWKQATKRAEEFWKLNPELRELHKLHVAYEREFVRRRRNRNNKWVHGFKQRPTFTQPDAVKHPRSFVFNAPQTSPQGYRDLRLPQRGDAIGTAELLLLSGERQNGEYPRSWVRVRFKGDPRLADFKPVKVKDIFRKGKDKGADKEKSVWEFFDRHWNRKRAAQISGAKLMFRNVRLNEDGSLRSAEPYLVFTCSVEDERWSEAARAVKFTEDQAPPSKGKRRKRAMLPEGLVACAVDFGIRHLGFATLAQYGAGKPQVLRSRNIWLGHEEEGGAHPGRWSEGPDLAHLARHKKKVRLLRRQRGKPVHGEKSHVELQDHITHMAEDRFKKGARAVINFALNVDGQKDKNGNAVSPADVLVIESLGGLVPDAERERGINRALIEFNRGHLVDRIREMAQDVGLRVLTINPVGTSQVCSRCGSLGRRYSIRRNPESHAPDIHFGWVEKLFACRCGYRANSDHNASFNLHRRLALGDTAVKAFYDWKSKDDSDRERQVIEIENELLPKLRQQHGLKQAALAAELPF